MDADVGVAGRVDMSPDVQPAAVDDVLALEHARRRRAHAVHQLETLGTSGLLRAVALHDMPQVLGIAARGVQAAIDRDDLAIRAAAVRTLHVPSDRGGGLIVCTECSAIWPCPTLQALDGAAAP